MIDFNKEWGSYNEKVHKRSFDWDILSCGHGHGNDPYEIFLSGAISLLSIHNPRAETKRELVLFRDSFGSSIAPLLVDGYSKVTLIDIRYIDSSYAETMVDFENADVLFLYSTSVLNHSETLK